MIKNLKVIVAGKDKADKYLEKIAKLNLTDTFEFLPSVDAVEEYYHAVDIFVLPALIEEFGRSVLEAMACGKPVVVSKTVGSSEILEGESKDYVLYDLTDTELTSKLESLIESKDLREKLGNLNKEVAKKYSSNAQKDKFHDLLVKLGYDF